jgi:PTS system nitrogen regulatory IIA component
MSNEWLTLDDLSRHLGRDSRELERLIQRGRIPAHKRNNQWLFHPAEITEWLEQEMREYNDSQLAAVELSQHSMSGTESRGQLANLLLPEHVQVPLEARTKRSVLESLVEAGGRGWRIWEPAIVLKAVIDRESLMSTAFESGVAIPHPRQPLPDSLEESVIAFGRTYSPIPFGAPNNEGTDLFFLVACRDARTHLQILARLGRLIRNTELLDQLRETSDAAASHRLIIEADASIDEPV